MSDAHDGSQQGSGGMVWMCISLSVSLVFLGLAGVTLGREIPAAGALIAAGLFAIAGAIAESSGRRADPSGPTGDAR